MRDVDETDTTGDRGDVGGERRQPRTVRRRDVGQRGGVTDGAHEDGELRHLTSGRNRLGGEDVQPTLAGGCPHAGAPRGLEHDGLAGPETQHRPTRCAAREARRRIVTDDVAGVGAVVETQGEAQVGVGTDVVVDDPGRALRGQHEVDAETAAPLGETDELAEKRRQLGSQRGELVDHDDEPRHGLITGTRPVFVEVGCPDGAQDALASAQLGFQAGQRTFGQPIVEIRHEPNGVREVGTGVERRAALVVDQHERQVVGAAARRQRHDERAQQLALAGASRPGDERVRPVSHEIDLDDTVGGEAERCGGSRIGAAGAPRRGDGDGVVDRADPVVLAQGTERDRRAQRLGSAGLLGVAQRGEASSHTLGVHERDARRVDDVRTSSDRRVGPPSRPTDRADLEHAAAHRRYGIARRHVHDKGR